MLVDIKWPTTGSDNWLTGQMNIYIFVSIQNKASHNTREGATTTVIVVLWRRICKLLTC